MHIVNTIKTYICEYAFINSTKVSILQYKKKELFKTKWPYFINICRLQIIIGLIQIICNSLLFTNYDKYKSIDVSISFIINIIDRLILNKINNKGKLIIIILIITCYSFYLTIFHNHQILSLELITNFMWMIILIGTQPLFIFKYIMFLSYYLYFCSYLAFWQQNYYDFIIVILIFILLTISEEEKFRKLIQNQIIPQQIINSLPQPIFLIKLSTLELLICNEQFKEFIKQLNGTKQNNISDILSHFESYGNQKILDLEDSDGLNLFETIQIIKLKQSRIKSFSYQFTYNNKVYDARFQSNILYNDYRCVLVSLSDISVVIERAKLTERTILKSKLIKSLSHELRTRKNIIQGLLKLHLDKYKEEKNNELIFQAYNNSKIESNIISSILNYNLCLDNQITVKYQQIKVNEFLDKTLENFKYDLKQKSIQVLCNHYPETDYSLITDPELFEQIITNIISNSIKHCDKGNQSILSISISKETYPITQLEASNRKIAYKQYIKLQNQSSFQSNEIDCSQQIYETTLNIKIIDNGSGITCQKLKLIQEILQNDNYYQFAQSSSDGFYLGLRSCNLLLQKLNKSNKVDILIKSKEKEETEVILKFAIHESDQIGIEDNIQKVKTSISKLQHTCNCQQTILIVDDEPFNNLVLEQILQSLGFYVKKALNGLEALQIYRKQHTICSHQSCKLFYAIFMDYQMPVMNGLESTKAIIDECNKFQRIQTDIIGCTAFSATEDINHLLKAGMKTQRFYKININDHMNNQFTNNSTLFSDQSLTPLQIREITTDILQKPSYLRKQKDIQILQLATQNIKFFQEILQDEGIQVLQKCLSKIQLEIYPESTIVFEKGDKGRDFYIILSGQVGIYIFSQNIESNQQIKIPIRQTIKDHVNQLIKQGTKPNSEHSIEIRKILLFEKTKKLLKVNELHEGDSFGERALINEAARLATVVCETECYFGVLNKQDYREILQQAQSEKIQHQITELQSIQGFQGMSRKLLTILLYAFQSQEYKFRDLVYKQGQPSKQELYLILNGEFMITQDKKVKTFNPYKINYQGVKSIAILQKGSIFGDKESFQQIEFRTQTISCNSDYGKVLCIQLSQLQQRLQANNEMHLINELQQQLQIKEVSREIRTNVSQIHMKSPKRPKSVFYQNSPNQKIDEIVKQKKKIFEWLNKDVKVKTQFIFDLHPPRSKTPIQKQSTENQSRQIRRGSAIEKILQNHLDTNSRNMKRKSLDQTSQNCKQEIRRFSFF